MFRTTFLNETIQASSTLSCGSLNTCLRRWLCVKCALHKKASVNEVLLLLRAHLTYAYLVSLLPLLLSLILIRTPHSPLAINLYSFLLHPHNLSLSFLTLWNRNLMVEFASILKTWWLLGSTQRWKTAWWRSTFFLRCFDLKTSGDDICPCKKGSATATNKQWLSISQETPRSSKTQKYLNYFPIATYW